MKRYDFDLSKKVSADDLNHGSGHKPGGNKPSAPSMIVGDMKKYINKDGGVMKKSMLVLFRRSAA